MLEIVDAENWTPEEHYYVHIDVLHGSSSLVNRRINKHMIIRDSFDPRRAVNFPSDLRDENRQGKKFTLKERRELAGVGDQYYELWKVRKEFSLREFGQMVDELPQGVKVRIVRMIDNDHDINSYPLEQALLGQQSSNVEN